MCRDSTKGMFLVPEIRGQKGKPQLKVRGVGFRSKVPVMRWSITWKRKHVMNTDMCGLHWHVNGMVSGFCNLTPKIRTLSGSLRDFGGLGLLDFPC